jgi:ketosteroid isomerase-like protein
MFITNERKKEMSAHQPEATTVQQNIETYPDQKSKETAEIMRRFNEVFLRHDPSELPELVAEDCIIEKIAPGPEGDRCVGRDACAALWQAIATEPGTHFDLEEVFAAGDRAIIRWRFWRNENESVRGVNLMRVNEGRIVEARGYVKGA